MNMKKIIYILLLNFGVISANGQDFYMYVNGQKHYYELSTKKLLVKSTLLDTVEIKKSIQVNTTDKIRKIHKLTKELLMIDLSNVDKETTLELLKKYNSNDDIIYASSVLLDKTGNNVGGITNQIFVRLKSITDYHLLKKNIKKYSINAIELCNFDDKTYLITIDKNSENNAMYIANKLYETGYFDYAEPNLIQFLNLSTNDQYFLQQWALNNTGQFGGTSGIDIRANPAWSLTTGSSNTRIAILDTGVDLTHPDLQANLLSGFDATGNGGNGNVLNGLPHGTACAGIAASIGNNTIGIAGVAYGCRIMPVSIASTNSNWTTTESGNIANAIDWARQNGASVISMSFGCIETNAMNIEISEAATIGRNNNGCILVAATGNNNSPFVNYPAINENVIAVGAISNCGQRKSPTSCDGENWGSNFGTHLDIVAPGVKIYTTDIQGSAGYNTSNGTIGNYYASFSGTSAATPHVAGVAALILSVRPDLNGRQVRDVIEQTAQKVGGYSYTTTTGRSNGTWNDQMGYGLVNAYAAVNAIFTRISGPSTICNQETYSINNKPEGATVTWSSSPSNLITHSTTGDSITATKTGSGQVTLTAVVNGTAISKNIWLGSPSIPLITGPQHVEVGGMGSYSASVLSDFNTTYQWSVSPSSHTIYNSGANATIYFNAQSDYTITVSTTNSCGTRTTYYYVATGELEPFSIYPNPATDLLTVSYNSATENKGGVENYDNQFTIQLWNETNGLVKSIESNSSTKQISLRGLPKGMYSVHIVKEKKAVKKQIIWIK